MFLKFVKYQFIIVVFCVCTKTNAQVLVADTVNTTSTRKLRKQNIAYQNIKVTSYLKQYPSSNLLLQKAKKNIIIGYPIVLIGAFLKKPLDNYFQKKYPSGFDNKAAVRSMLIFAPIVIVGNYLWIKGYTQFKKSIKSYNKEKRKTVL
jgi:hypothetical protein